MPTSIVTTLTNAKDIACGSNHSLAVDANGALWAWGYNNRYQLGDGTTLNKSSPVQIGVDTDWVAVAAGDSHSLALKSNGEVYAWGRNNSGECGITGGGTLQTPTQVTFPVSVVIDQIAADGSTSLFADTFNTAKVYGCGTNLWKQIDTTGTTVQTPIEITDFTGATKIAVGDKLIAAARTNDIAIRGAYIFDTDTGGFGSYTVPITLTARDATKYILTGKNILDLDVGDIGLLAVTDTGEVWGIGDPQGYYSNSSNANTYDTASAVRLFSLLSQSGGSVAIFTTVTFGLDSKSITVGSSVFSAIQVEEQYPTTIGFQKVSCGIDHFYLLDTDGYIWTHGNNNSGQLGRTTTDQVGETTLTRLDSAGAGWLKVACGSNHSLATLS
jgi:alpha-tubulin suppressor-like RCC1 family protein